MLSDGHILVLHSMALQKEAYDNPASTCLSKESFVCVCVCVHVCVQKWLCRKGLMKSILYKVSLLSPF